MIPSCRRRRLLLVGVLAVWGPLLSGRADPRPDAPSRSFHVPGFRGPPLAGRADPPAPARLPRNASRSDRWARRGDGSDVGGGATHALYRTASPVEAIRGRQVQPTYPTQYVLKLNIKL